MTVICLLEKSHFRLCMLNSHYRGTSWVEMGIFELKKEKKKDFFKSLLMHDSF